MQVAQWVVLVYMAAVPRGCARAASMPLPCLTRMVLPLRSECSSRRRGGARVVCACVRADKCEAPAARNERLWLGITSSDRRAWMQTNYCSSSKRESSSGRARTSRSTLVPGLTSIQILVHRGLVLRTSSCTRLQAAGSAACLAWPISLLVPTLGSLQ